ncbi:hypothetical protein CYMTET_41143 [Cymbomonas tetramitiformis]|uniref:Uncharacterized protein n=1 Tax=Cymbomonas tetramitiformis TaxID=36881 RepID=A0AAE0F2X9_9CHLO|nr:hypothetical protein CYMTET_41143 [Cymbomonas tetramitiformis]
MEFQLCVIPSDNYHAMVAVAASTASTTLPPLSSPAAPASAAFDRHAPVDAVREEELRSQLEPKAPEPVGIMGWLSMLCLAPAPAAKR